MSGRARYPPLPRRTVTGNASSVGRGAVTSLAVWPHRCVVGGPWCLTFEPLERSPPPRSSLISRDTSPVPRQYPPRRLPRPPARASSHLDSRLARYRGGTPSVARRSVGAGLLEQQKKPLLPLQACLDLALSHRHPICHMYSDDTTSPPAMYSTTLLPTPAAVRYQVQPTLILQSVLSSAFACFCSAC